MSRQLFRHRKLLIDVQVDDQICDQSVADRLAFLASRDDWFHTYTRGSLKRGESHEIQPE